jgi:ribonuclease-3
MNNESHMDLPVEAPNEFSKRLNLTIKNNLLLTRALTHRSFLNENPEALEDNERLEFLGDAVLDFLVGAWLYNRYPEKAEGELTRLRSALVRTEQLAEFANNIGLGAALRLGKGEASSGGRKRQAILCGGFEALIGALFLDAGMDSVREFIEPMLEPAAESILLTRKHQDPKSTLQEWIQAQGLPPPGYKTLTSTGPEHEKQFEVAVMIDERILGIGSGRSKQLAAKEAARSALVNLGVD